MLAVASITILIMYFLCEYYLNSFFYELALSDWEFF